MQCEPISPTFWFGQQSGYAWKLPYMSDQLSLWWQTFKISLEIIFSCHIGCLSKDTKKKNYLFTGKNLTSMAILKHLFLYSLYLYTYTTCIHINLLQESGTHESLCKWHKDIKKILQGCSRDFFFTFLKYWLFIVRNHIQDWTVYISLQIHILESNPLAWVICWYLIQFT